MANKWYPEIELLAYTKAAIPQRGNPGFIVADVLGEKVNLGMGDGMGADFEAINPTIADAWTTQFSGGAFKAIDTTLDFVRFRRDGFLQEGASYEGEKSELSGFILRGRTAFLDCKIGTTNLDTSSTNLTWSEVVGKWKTVLPPESPQRTRILNTGSETSAFARTAGNLPANRSFRCDVRFSSQKASSAQPSWAIQWGDDLYAVVLRHGMKPTVEKKINGEWVVMRRLEQSGSCNLAGGRYTITVRRIAGRLVVGFNGRNYYFLEAIQGANPNSKPRPADSNWPAGPLSVATQNVRATIGIGVIKYSMAGGTLFEGSFIRHCKRRTPIDSGGTLAGYSAGWKSAGTAVSVTPEALAGGLDYTCTLRASQDGIDTPFVNKCMLRFAPVWNQGAPPPLDLSAAVKRIGVSLAQPPILNGAEATVEVDRVVLDALNASWTNWVQEDHPITLRIRWRYDDGSVDTWTNLFTGYIWKVHKATTGFAQNTMTLTLRDSIIRLQRPAAVIDHRQGPLDLVFARIAAENPVQPICWGTDLVREVLLHHLGPDVADSLNGGDYQGTGFFPASHYPLMSYDNDICGYVQAEAALNGQPLTANQWLFPPTFGQDALGWILSSIAPKDHAVFYFGWPDGDTTKWPSPIYGRILNLVAGRSTKILPDTVYAAGDINKLLLSAETETRPDRAVNRVLVWSNDNMSELAQLLPALRMAEARVSASDINAPELTWEKTLVIRDNFVGLPGSAEAVAMAVIAQFKNRIAQWPKFTTRGDATFQWGDKFQLKQEAVCPEYSDTSLGLAGLTFRAERVEHNIDLESVGVENFTTALYVRPLSASGW